MIGQDILDRVRRIKLLILDIDGVMTDGHIIYSIYGDELKFFDVQDGFGITLLARAGIKSVIITAKKSRIVKLRARDMKVAGVYQGYTDKLKAFEHALRKFRVKPEEVCFIGDDLIDIPVLKRAGLAVAVPNAVDEVRASAHIVTLRAGGHGGVRELCDLILKTQEKWDPVTEKYFK
ncbi:MAG: HAD-IIIA family hydrolase [Candidatus Omnitrophica bacterium]|nr:HAD-IIIA family hydrolase [Candidatus Omnitrophota bacterium]